MKILFGTLSLIFVLFAVVQYNDPDPLIWITYYLAVAVITGAAAMGKDLRWLVIATSVVSVAGLVYYFPGVYDWAINHNAENIAQSMKADKMYIEETREFFGLVISLTAIILVFRKRKQLKI
jgi:hypothetical protein